MSRHDEAPWLKRYLRVSAALMLGVALLLWVTPVNVPGTNLVPFGCGSPAAPTSGELARFVCTSELDAVKALVIVLLVVAGGVLLLSEVGVDRWGRKDWFPAVALIAPLAAALLAWSVVSTFLVVGSVAADGSLIRCGTAIAPATDTISVGLCGQLTERRMHLGLGGALFAAGLVAGAVYVGGGRASTRTGASPDGDESSARLDPREGP
jgi:hypothetical protein